MLSVITIRLTFIISAEGGEAACGTAEWRVRALQASKMPVANETEYNNQT